MFVYGLQDPLTQELRYVGATNNLQRRMVAHLSSSRKTHKERWVRSLLDRGLKPDIFVIEEISEKDWRESERFWIAYFRYIGANLTNHTDGGEGTLGFHHSHKRPDLALFNRNNKKGLVLSEEHKRKIGNKMRGKQKPIESVAKRTGVKRPGTRPDNVVRNKLNRHVGWHHTYDSRQKISDAKKKYWEAWRILSGKL